MEGGTNMLVNELVQGHGLARELESQLSPASIDLCKSLAQDVLASIEKAIAMAKLVAVATDSPRSFTGSPHSEISEHPFRAEGREMIPFPKKRKTQAKLTTQVKLGSGPEAEGPLEDGYSWRKYGQKEILGAKHPRGYYRCTHRNSHGCLAIKQVQRSDENPAIFEVTYRGTHTCRREPSPLPAAAAAPSFPNLDHHNNQLLLSFQTNLKVETENLQDSKSFSFPSTYVDRIKHESHVFSPASTLDNCFKRSFTDAFISPATSGSNYLSRGGLSLQASESDFTEIVSGVTSPSHSSLLDLDFLSELDFSLVDTSSFFPCDV